LIRVYSQGKPGIYRSFIRAIYHYQSLDVQDFRRPGLRVAERPVAESTRLWGATGCLSIPVDQQPVNAKLGITIKIMIRSNRITGYEPFNR